MKRGGKIALTVIAWTAILLYIIWASGLGRRSRDNVKVERLIVEIADSADIDIIRPATVEKWILDANMWPVGEMASEINTGTISSLALSQDFVRTAKTYVDLDGTITVSVTQRKPVMRFITDNGYDFYVTGDGYVVPVRGRAAHYVPIVTGTFDMPFDKAYSGRLDEALADDEKKEVESYLFLSKLINFVTDINRDDFWSSQIVQINVTEAPVLRTSTQLRKREPEIELIPRVGDHVVLLGRLDGYQDKLNKLMLFYKGALNPEGWSLWNHINLKYDNQIVCSNK